MEGDSFSFIIMAWDNDVEYHGKRLVFHWFIIMAWDNDVESKRKLHQYIIALVIKKIGISRRTCIGYWNPVRIPPHGIMYKSCSTNQQIYQIFINEDIIINYYLIYVLIFCYPAAWCNFNAEKATYFTVTNISYALWPWRNRSGSHAEGNICQLLRMKFHEC
jgi:hypothetical protein